MDEIQKAGQMDRTHIDFTAIEKHVQALGIKTDFLTILKDANDYQDIRLVMEKVLGKMKELNVPVGFVSGTLGTKGVDWKEKKRLLLEYEAQVRAEFPNHFTFSSLDIFHDALWPKIEALQHSDVEKSAEMDNLFDHTLRAGVKDVFMARGWEEAEGARKEYVTSLETGIKIHFQEPPQIPVF